MFGFIQSIRIITVFMIFGMSLNIVYKAYGAFVAKQNTKAYNALEYAKSVVMELESRKATLTPSDLQKLSQLKALVAEKENTSNKLDSALDALKKVR